MAKFKSQEYFGNFDFIEVKEIGLIICGRI